MAKTKRKHLATIAGGRKTQSPKDERGKTADKGMQPWPSTESLANDDGWIEVRKQRITILIPALPTTRQSPPLLKQENKETLPVAVPDAKDVQDSTTYFTRRRINSTDHTKVNKNRSKVILKIGELQEEGFMNKIHISKEGNEGTLVSNKDAESQQALIKSNASESYIRHDCSPDLCTKESRQGSRKDCALGISYYFKRAKRHRRSENCVTEGALKEVSLGMGSPYASGNSIHSKIGMQLDKVDFHQDFEAQDGNQKDCKKDNLAGKDQGMPMNDMARSCCQVGSPEVTKCAQGDNFPCIGVMNLQQNASTILQNNKMDIVKDGDEYSSYKQVLCSSLDPSAEDNPVDKPTIKSEGAEASIAALARSDENLTNARALEKSQSMPSALVYVNFDKLNDSYQFCPSSSTNEAIRAYTLKKQLEKAGGIKKWLLSLGLEQFIEFFEKKKFDESELMHLSMNDLKMMGAKAVGPRRKLIWAINHLCQKLTW